MRSLTQIFYNKQNFKVEPLRTKKGIHHYSNSWKEFFNWWNQCREKVRFLFNVTVKANGLVAATNAFECLQNTTDFSTDSYSYCWCNCFFVVDSLRDFTHTICLNLRKTSSQMMYHLYLNHYSDLHLFEAKQSISDNFFPSQLISPFI